MPKPKSRKSEKSTPRPVAVKPAEAELPRILDQLDRLPEEEKQKAIQTLVVQYTRKFSGPLPSPEYFEKYNQVLEGAAALGLAGSVTAIFRHLTKWIRK